MRFAVYYVPFYYFILRRAWRVGKDGRVGMLDVNSRIVWGCNLRCEYCTAYSPYLQGWEPADKLLASYVEWRKKIKPRKFHIYGGEPLLHPELERIVRESAKIWDDAILSITTNGLFLDSLKPEVLHAIKETGYTIAISEHTFEPEHRKKLDAGYARLKAANIPFAVNPSRVSWLAIHEYNEKGEIIPYQSNPKKAWSRCVFRHCHIIDGDSLCKCSLLSSVLRACKKGALNSDYWKPALTYQPLTLQATAEEIVDALRTKEIPACAICPDKRNMVAARQLPVMKQVQE